MCQLFLSINYHNFLLQNVTAMSLQGTFCNSDLMAMNLRSNISSPATSPGSLKKNMVVGSPMVNKPVFHGEGLWHWGGSPLRFPCAQNGSAQNLGTHLTFSPATLTMVWVPSNQLSCSLGAKKRLLLFLVHWNDGHSGTPLQRGDPISMIHTKKGPGYIGILCFSFQLPKCWWRGTSNAAPQWSSRVLDLHFKAGRLNNYAALLAVGEVCMWVS